MAKKGNYTLDDKTEIKFIPLPKGISYWFQQWLDIAKSKDIKAPSFNVWSSIPGLPGYKFKNLRIESIDTKNIGEKITDGTIKVNAEVKYDAISIDEIEVEISLPEVDPNHIDKSEF